MDKLEKYFIENIKPNDSSIEILNWYRNLYYKEEPDTERGVVARAINNLFISFNTKEKKKSNPKEIKNEVECI